MSMFESKKDLPEEVADEEIIEEEIVEEEIEEEIEEELVEEVAEAAEPKKRFKFTVKNTRKFRIGATATAVTAAVAAVVVLLNVVVGLLNDRFPFSLDLTTDKSYTLSEESEAVADKVTEDVTITVFMAESQFSAPAYGNEMDVILRQFYQFTKDYHSMTGGKVTTEYIDLDANPTLASTYEKYGVSAGSVLFRCGEQWRAITVDDLYSLDDSNYYYTGEYSISSLVEQKLASNINAVSGGKTVVLTFLTGHGESSSYITALSDLYEMNGYVIETADFSAATEISPNTGALVIVAPNEDYTVEEIKRLRAWLSNSGARERHLFVYCNFAVSCPNLYEFLEVDYGITVTDNLVWETDTNNIPMSYYGSYPYSPFTTIQSTDLTTDVGSNKVIMPLTLQLLTAHTNDTSMYSTTNHAVVTFPESAKLVSNEELNNEEATIDTIVKTDAEEYPIIGVAYAYDYDYNDDNEQIGNYVFVSGSYQIIDYITSGNYTNEDLVLNPMRAVCSLGDTTVISGKELTTDTVSFDATTFYVLGLGIFTIGIPLALVILSVIMFIRRRHL